MSTAIANLIFHVPWWGYGVVVGVAFLAGIYRFAPEILKQIYEQLSVIAKIFGGFFLSIGKLIF